MKESLMKGHILYETSSQKIQILGSELVNVGVWYPGPIKQQQKRKEMQFGPKIEPYNIHMSFSHCSLVLDER